LVAPPHRHIARLSCSDSERAPAAYHPSRRVLGEGSPAGGLFQSGDGIANWGSLPTDAGLGCIYVCLPPPTGNQGTTEADVSTCNGTLHITDKNRKSRILCQSQRMKLNSSRRNRRDTMGPEKTQLRNNSSEIVFKMDAQKGGDAEMRKLAEEARTRLSKDAKPMTQRRSQPQQRGIAKKESCETKEGKMVARRGPRWQQGR
jgi:hypothetical protein